MSLDFANIESVFAAAFPAARLTSVSVPLPGGHLNEVWRLYGSNGTSILKYAPPHIASLPDVPLDQHRIRIEADMLELLDQNGMLGDVATMAVRTPQCYYFDPAGHILVMEDVAPHGPLDQIDWSADGDSVPSVQLGQFVGNLHGRSQGDAMLKKRINNQSIQTARLNVQYQSVGSMLKEAGNTDWEIPGQHAKALGEKYVSAGKCLIMGDLWPRSILVDTARQSIRIIDWELAHFGRPSQDVAHLAAHYWMMAHCAPDESSQVSIRAAWAGFFQGYSQALGQQWPALWDDEEERDASIHFGCEILARTIGSFRDSYLYENLEPKSPVIQQAVALAVQSMVKPRDVEDLGPGNC